MKPTVYLETTIPSYLTAWKSSDVIISAHQQLTQAWWDQRDRFDLFVSQIVIRECRAGDQDAAARRIEVIEGIPILDVSDPVAALARDLVEQGTVPVKAAVDAIHIAIAVVNSMQYLLTWNCRHIANAAMRNAIEDVCRLAGYEPVVICTPEELMEDQDYGTG